MIFMRHIRLFQTLLLLALVPAATYAGTGMAPLTMVAESKTILSDPTTPVSGFFDVFFSVMGDNPPAAGYQLRLDLVPADGGIALGAPVSTGSTAPMRMPLFPTPPTDLGSTASRIQATDFLANGANSIADLNGLVRVPFTVSPNTSGTYSLNIDPATTALSDAGGGPITFQITNGTLSVAPIPEPSAVLLAGVMLAIVVLRTGCHRGRVGSAHQR
jgi:hypothetical protein